MRDRVANTIGNLALVTKSLNGSLSNRPWSDSDATVLIDGGEPGKGKRSLLDAFSLLVLNKEIVQDHINLWSEDDIKERSVALTKAITEVWSGPSMVIQGAAYEAARA